MDDLTVKEEEVFFERHFEYGDDDDTSWSNYLKALKLFIQYSDKAYVLADDISNGEVVDTSTAVFEIKNTIYAYKYLCMFRRTVAKVDYDIKVCCMTDITSDNAVSCSEEELINHLKNDGDYQSFEKNMYLLCKTK